MGRPLPLKFALIGETSTGKTSLLVSFAKDQFADEFSLSSIETLAKTVTVDDEKYNVTLVDSSGSVRHDRIRPMSYYYPVVDVFLICYSINDRSSFDKISSRWVFETQKHCPSARLFLVGTKHDLKPRTPDAISEGECFQLAKAVNASGFLECSSKSGENVHEVFNQAVRIARLKFEKPK